jgi:hypothetical protein
VLVVWLIRAGSYVMKQALELPLFACISLVLAEFFANQLVLHALSSPPPTAPT